MPIQQGMNQQTAAAINTIRRGIKSTARGAVRRAKRRRSGAKNGAGRSRKRRAAGSSKRLPKFGSPAWRKKFGLDKKRRKRR